MMLCDSRSKVLPRVLMTWRAMFARPSMMVFALLQRTSLPVDHVAHSSGATLLHLAAERGHVDVVSFLLGKGAEVNKTRQNGATALYAAAHNGRVEVVKTLLNKGQSININKARTDDGGA